MQTLARVHERNLEMRLLQVETLKLVEVGCVERVPVVDDADWGAGCWCEGVVVELVLRFGAYHVVGEHEVELEDHIWDCHLGDKVFDEG